MNKWIDIKHFLRSNKPGFCWIEMENIDKDKIAVIAWYDGLIFVSIDSQCKYNTVNIFRAARIEVPK